MRKLLIILVSLLVSTGAFAFSMQNEPNQSEMQAWENVQVVYNADEVSSMEKGEIFSETLNTSLNFGTKSKFKRNVLKELKKEAHKKGYSVILIDEAASKDKRYNKRGIEITMVAIGYKS